MSSPKANNSQTPAAPGLLAFTLSTVVVCFVGFSIVYLCRCWFGNIMQTWAFQRSSSPTLVRLSSTVSPSRGLDPSLLQTFPTFLYATVKNLRKDNNKYSLECAICLLEFEDHTMLRLLTTCYHLFHQECIDLWLRSHRTCPVCRFDLDSPTDQPNSVSHQEEIMDHVCIDVKEGDADVRHDEAVSISLSVQQNQERKFDRSHSTGHSIVMIRGGDDKYRLSLKLVRGGHNYSKSCSSYKDITVPCTNCGHVQTTFASSSRSGTENI